MGKLKQYKSGIGAFISSEKGQRFFNFAYSIGAAIVIWGALFKILHLPGGNFLLSLGMGTEVLMFVLTAFDRPPKEYHWEKVYPSLVERDAQAEDSDAEGAAVAVGQGGVGGTVIIGGGGVASEGSGEGGTVIIGGGGPAVIGGGGVIGGGVIGGGMAATAVAGGIPADPSVPLSAPVIAPGAAPAEVVGQVNDATQLYLNQITDMTNELRHLQDTTRALNTVSDTLLESYRAITENSAEITASSQGYVEQMQGLNRNISGLNTIYEIQLKSISSQLDAIDRVNRGIKDIRDMYEKSSASSERYCEETEKMARYMHQLNTVYEKMITAMTINMYNPMAAAGLARDLNAEAPAEPEQGA